MFLRKSLFVPGPTNLPDVIRKAIDVPMEDHRAPDLPEFILPLLNDVKKVFKTISGQVFIFPASGTGAWEAAVTNTLNPGDKVLAARFGQFSHLWIDMCERLGLNVQVVECEWGTGVPMETFREILSADKSGSIKAVLATQNETATGVKTDIGAIRNVMDDANHQAMLYVDGVSSIASVDFQMDAWGVDLAVSGSQKGFMLPAGLAIMAASQKAIKASENASMRRCYFDFGDMVKTNATGYFPYTPPMSLLRGLRASLDRIFDEGLENIFARHTFLAEGVRQAVSAWGLSLCAREPQWLSLIHI